MKFALFWDIKQRRVVISYWCFGTAYWSHPRGSKVRNYHSPLPNMPEERRSYPSRPEVEITGRNMFVLVKDIIVLDLIYGWFYLTGESVLTRHLLVRILGTMCGDITTFLLVETKRQCIHKPRTRQLCLIVREVLKGICKRQVMKKHSL
jgi:hypothetical protein